VLINHIITDDGKAKSAYLTWLQNLRPQEVTDIKILEGAVGEPLLQQQVKDSHTQIFVTTHSAIILSWLNEDEYAHYLLLQTR